VFILFKTIKFHTLEIATGHNAPDPAVIDDQHRADTTAPHFTTRFLDGFAPCQDERILVFDDRRKNAI